MRVTKIIKDYIEREVNVKYQEKLKSIPNDYQEDYDKMIEELDAYVEKCDIKAKEIAEKYGMLNDVKTILSYSSYRLGNDERLYKRREVERNLKTEKDNKIAQIILDLELGATNKKELQDILNNVTF